MIISRAGLAVMGIADGIMVARFQSHEFAWLSLAEGTLGRVLDIFIAFLIGGLSLVPRHFVQGDATGARNVWLRTIPVSLALGVVGLLLSLAGIPFLRMMGQAPELAAGAGPVMVILGAGYPAALLAISAAIYLEGLNRPHFVALSVVSANVLNVVLNWLFIGGHWGFAAMGARGSALSTTLVRFALAVALAGFAWRARAAASEITREHLAERNESQRTQWKLGIGAASTVAAMVVLTSSLTVFAGWLGVLPLAVFAAAWALSAPAGLVGLGMSDAAGIYVASEIGRSGERSGASVAWACLGITLVPILLLVEALSFWPQMFAGIYTTHAEMRDSMATMIPLVAFILLVDSAGFVISASLRAFREVAWPAAIEIGSLILLVPLAMLLAFERGYGVRGLFLAMLLAGVLRAALLVWRFRWRTTRHVAIGRKTEPGEWNFYAQ
jgi:MATE family multidrug resistance protein